jgi:anaerobic magnesium-protoporphyrin IX monomethyl ester cyclase
MNNIADILLLTTPRSPHLSPEAVGVSENSAPPLGLLCVAAALEHAGFQVAVYDFYRMGGKPRDVVELLKKTNPRIVGISTLTSGVHMAYRVCRHIKQTSPELVTVLGGPHATALPEEVAMHPEVDFAVRGEGEQTMVELAETLLRNTNRKFEAINGLAFQRDDEVCVTNERAPLLFDESPKPARHLVPMDRYLQQGAVVTSRGCTYRCWFCSSVTFNTHKYRYKSSDLVVAEIDELHERYGTKSFEFIEDTFSCVPDRVRELMGLLKGKNYEWSCQVTIPDLDKNPNLIPLMVESGCRGMFFGIESGNDAVLRKIKGMTRTKILSTIDHALDQGIHHIVTSFIIGHPWDTRDTIADTKSLILELRQRGIHTPISILVPFPGSPIGKWPERFGVTVHSSDYSEYFNNRALISTQHLKRDELQNIYLEILDDVLTSPLSPTELLHNASS